VASLRDSGFRRSSRIHRLEQSSVKEIETLEGWGHPFPIEPHDVSSYSKLPEEAETTLIRGRLQGTETRLLYRALGGTFHHPNAASPPLRPWLCNLLTEWVLHRHYVPNGGEPKATSRCVSIALEFSKAYVESAHVSLTAHLK
jgi:hypothetical protein